MLVALYVRQRRDTRLRCVVSSGMAFIEIAGVDWYDVLHTLLKQARALVGVLLATRNTLQCVRQRRTQSKSTLWLQYLCNIPRSNYQTSPSSSLLFLQLGISGKLSPRATHLATPMRNSVLQLSLHPRSLSVLMNSSPFPQRTRRVAREMAHAFRTLRGGDGGGGEWEREKEGWQASLGMVRIVGEGGTDGVWVRKRLEKKTQSSVEGT